MLDQLRVGIIDYLNILPVYYALLQKKVPLPCQQVWGVPAELNRKMAAGELDISVISSFEYAKRSEQYWLLPNLSVSADGPVGSIFLLSHQPLKELSGTVLLTNTSYTSNHLVQYLLRNHDVSFYLMGTRHPDDFSAKMLIGDAAIRSYYEESFPYVYDLAELWKQETGLPFVFALWAVRDEVYQQSPELVTAVYEALLASKEQSQHLYDAMAADYNQRIFPSESLCADYLRNLHHDLTPECQQGFLLFQERCFQQGFLEKVSPLRFAAN